MKPVSRRSLLVGGASTLGIAGAAAVVGACDRTTRSEATGDGESRDLVVPFRGEHQAGIVTPAQDRLYFAAFDVVTDDADELRRLFVDWTTAAERMTQGLDAAPDGAVGGPLLAPPTDTGEALGLPASHLTITFGVGRTLFVSPSGDDRFGLASRAPAGLIDLPHFAGDNLDPSLSGGDVCIQACADDPQVAFHAVRNLARMGFGVVALRWSQLGFGRTSSTSSSQVTPRNLFGFKDGTDNVTAEQADALNDNVWVQADDESGDAAWMAGGTYLVARRIDMRIETWDRSPLGEQEAVFGRTKDTGAPLSGGDEFTKANFEMQGRDGPIIPETAHVRLAHPDQNNGKRMLRRGYNFTDGNDGLGRMSAGLFFIAFVRDIATNFVAVQERLAASDALNEYIVHTGSAVFAVPPGLVGEATLADVVFG